MGDGLRREWFDEAVAEIVHADRGLFTSADGGWTLQPNPNSEVMAGPDHLAYFAVLGRITGLALYHQEPLDVQWTDAFVKATLELPVTADDILSVDPELHRAKVVYLRECSAEELDALGLTFEDDGSNEVMGQMGPVPLKESHLDPVTKDNLEEYLQLLAEHRLLGAIQPQVKAFRDGLGMILIPELRTQLRQCCTAQDFQQLVCGVKEIDVAAWQQGTRYRGLFTADSVVVRWFWNLVDRMREDERGVLLHFVTGSSRAPAAGFGSLMGYADCLDILARFTHCTASLPSSL